MHIAVNLGVQKIASYQVDNLLPEEIDHELNLAMTRFIKQKYNPSSNRLGKGFEQSQKRVDDLRSLVVDDQTETYNHGITGLGDALGKYVYTANRSNIYVDRATLPLDYMFLVGVRAIVNYSCDKPITSNLLATIDLPTTRKYLVAIPMYPAYATNLNDYVLSTIVFNEATGVQIDGFINYNDLKLPVLHDVLIDSNNWNEATPVLSQNTQNTSLGTTHSTPTEQSNNLLIEVSEDFYHNLADNSSIIITWEINNIEVDTVKINKDQFTITETVNRKIAIPNGNSRISLCKFAQHDDVINMMLDPFNITDYRSPVYTIEENFIDIHTDNTFTVPEVILKYIRTPKNMSIKDGIGCELAEHTHPEIVEMAIKSILEGIQDPRYQTQTLENLESE
jgi:hypothetical protein